MNQANTEKPMGHKVLALGIMLAALMAAWLALAAGPAHATTAFTVNSTRDVGDDNPGDGECFTGVVLVIGPECTLRASIQEANAIPGADTIDFDVPTTAVATISPASQLPTITEAVTIDGYSQPGAKPNTLAVGNDAVLKVELSGPGSGSGLRIGAANSTVKGLVINRWGEGIHISESGATGNKFIGNYLGTDSSGTKDLGSHHGVHIIEAPNNTVGGATAGERNVISGNDGSGIQIEGANATGNKVIGNYVGTDKNGTAPLGNNSNGIYVSAPNNAVGGAAAAERNVISGNDAYGVAIDGANAGGNRVTGNYVGTDASGTKDLGNYYGVYIGRAPNNIIGGATAGARNVVSGNDSQGVIIFDTGATGNKVVGNYVGTDASGTKDLGNSQDGVFVSAPNNTVGGVTAGERNVISGNDAYGVGIYGAGGSNKVVGNYVGTDASGTKDLGNSLDGVHIALAPNNAVGGTTAGAGNVISGNGRDGVGIVMAEDTGNRVLSNSIFSNDGLGIDLLGGTENAAGATANDPKDPDTGPNNLQNFPVVTSVAKNAIKGTLNSKPGTSYTVQLFSNPSGEDEGKTLVGQRSVTTDGSGNASFSVKPSSEVAPGQSVTATATDPEGNTSEFSAPKTR